MTDTPTTTSIDPTTINISRSHMIAKETRGRWDNEPRTAKVKVFVFLNEDAWAPEGLTYPRHEDFSTDAGYEAAFKAYDRAVSKAYIAATRTVTEAFLDAMGMDLGKLQFSRKAGCSCGCSAGFTADATGQFDLYITATATAA